METQSVPEKENGRASKEDRSLPKVKCELPWYVKVPTRTNRRLLVMANRQYDLHKVLSRCLVKW